MTQSVVGDYPIELGMGLDIRSKARSLFQCVKQSYLDPEKGFIQLDKHEGGASTTHQITTSNKEATLVIAGSLEIQADIAEVANISGEAHIDYQNSDGNESVTRVFKAHVRHHRNHLDITELKPEDLALSTVPTHIVTDVVYGQNLSGHLTLSTSHSDSSIKAGGKLKVEIAKVPIGGSGEIDFNKTDFNKNYNFEARLKSRNYGAPLQCDNLENYLEQVKKWFEEPGEASIIQYTLQPLSKMKNFSSSLLTPIGGELNKDLKSLIEDINDLVEYVKYLQKQVELEEEPMMVLFKFQQFLTKAKRELMKKFYDNFDADEVEDALAQYQCLGLKTIKIIKNFFPEFKNLNDVIEGAKLQIQKKKATATTEESKEPVKEESKAPVVKLDVDKFELIKFDSCPKNLYSVTSDGFIGEIRKRDNGQEYMAWGTLMNLPNYSYPKIIHHLLDKYPTDGIDFVMGEGVSNTALIEEIKKFLSKRHDYSVLTSEDLKLVKIRHAKANPLICLHEILAHPYSARGPTNHSDYQWRKDCAPMFSAKVYWTPMKDGGRVLEKKAMKLQAATDYARSNLNISDFSTNGDLLKDLQVTFFGNYTDKNSEALWLGGTHPHQQINFFQRIYTFT